MAEEDKTVADLEKQIKQLKAEAKKSNTLIDTLRKEKSAGAEAVTACRECIDLLDPKGKGHLPGGSLAAYQTVLEKLKAAAGE